MCDCHSYNCPSRGGSTPEVVLDPRPYGWGTRSVSVDACMAPIIEALWRAGIITSGCCCGHGGHVMATPEIMVDDPRRVPDAAEIVAAIDPRWIKLTCYSRESRKENACIA